MKSFLGPLFSKLIAECLGAFALVFFGCGSILVHGMQPDVMPSFVIPFVFGITVAAMIYVLGHISGAHFNPAVTLGFAVARHFPKQMILPYWAAQLAGAGAASYLLYYLIPSDLSGMTLPSVSAAQAFIWEVILTFILMFTIMAVATDTRAVGVMAGSAIGAVITVCALVGGPFSGASMNPARSIGPMLSAGAFDYLWLYIAAPSLGAVAGALLYSAIRCPSPDETPGAGGCC